jgi:hypothetical protein
MKAANAALVREALLAAGYPEATPDTEGFSVSEGPVYVAVVVHGLLTPARRCATEVAEALADAGYSSLYEGIAVLIVKRALPSRTVNL